MSEASPPRRPETMDMTFFGPSHVKVYQETKGETGYLWNGATILLLTTKGRKSGQTRISPLIFVRDGEALAIIASKGGAPEHPAWYLNLRSDPDVQVQVKGEIFQAKARTAVGAERARIWDTAVKAWPQYADYQKRTAREIPVVVLERAGA